MSVFVTVGSTRFDDLTELVTTEPIINELQRNGYNELTVQFGKGSQEIGRFKLQGFSVEGYRYKTSISDDIKKADLIISHAGAGSCLESLEAGKSLIVVVNEKLMNNHQLELAQQLNKDSHLLYCTCSTLLNTLQELNLDSLKPFPPPKTSQFLNVLNSHFRF